MKDFLQSAEEQLILNKDKDSIITELSDHVETKKEFFESIGYDDETSIEKANEAMGNGEVIGQRLDMIHRSNMKIEKLLFAGVFVINIALNFVEIQIGNNGFLPPFLMALLALVSNFLFTAAAMRFKSTKTSIALIVCSFLPLLKRRYSLAYPLCNVIVRGLSADDYYFFYLFMPAIITFCLSAFIIIPNIINIYHCNQIKKLKNTRKQNKIALALRNACVIVAVAGFVLSVPYYALNERINDEQAAIRDELFGFALETANRFDYGEWSELAEYLESSEYDFKHNSRSYVSSNDLETYIYDSYIYDNGNWKIEFRFKGECPNEYSVFVDFIEENLSMNCLYTTATEISELIEKIGDPEVGPGNAMGRSVQEFLSDLIAFDLDGIYVNKSEDGINYRFFWQEPRTYFGCKRVYEFYCDTDDICYYYELY